MREKQTDQIETNKKERNSISPCNQLLGKVVLLIGNDTSILQNLISQLAQKGADIALLCWQMPREKAQKIKENVQATGSRLFLIEQADYKTTNPSQLIDSIVAKMGQLDIFIDLSAQKTEAEITDDKRDNGNGLEFSYPNWQFTQAALEEIAHT